MAKLASYLPASSSTISPSQGVVHAHSYSPRALISRKERRGKCVWWKAACSNSVTDRMMQDFSDYQTRSKQVEHSCDLFP